MDSGKENEINFGEVVITITHTKQKAIIKTEKQPTQRRGRSRFALTVVWHRISAPVLWTMTSSTMSLLKMAARKHATVLLTYHRHSNRCWFQDFQPV